MMGKLSRFAGLFALIVGLSACASTLPNGAPPVSSLYSFNDTARYMLRDVCLASVLDDVPVAAKTDVPAVYPVEGTSGAWRAGPGGAVQVTQLPGNACEVTVSRGVSTDLRTAFMREVETSRADFRLVDSVDQGGSIVDTYCAPFPSGLSVVVRTAKSDPTRSVAMVSARAGIRRDLCV